MNAQKTRVHTLTGAKNIKRHSCIRRDTECEVDVRAAIKTAQVHTFLLSAAIQNNKMTSVHRWQKR